MHTCIWIWIWISLLIISPGQTHHPDNRDAGYNVPGTRYMYTYVNTCAHGYTCIQCTWMCTCAQCTWIGYMDTHGYSNAMYCQLCGTGKHVSLIMYERKILLWYPFHGFRETTQNRFHLKLSALGQHWKIILSKYLPSLPGSHLQPPFFISLQWWLSKLWSWSPPGRCPASSTTSWLVSAVRTSSSSHPTCW